MLAAGIAEVRDVDPDRLTGPALSDTIVQLEQLLSQLEAAVTDKAAAWEQRGCYEADGAKSPAAWLAWKTRKPIGECRRRLRLGRTCTVAPVAAAAWRGGAISGAHLDLLATVRTPATAEVFARDEQLLVDQAATLRFSAFTKAVKYWHELADPDGTDRDAESQRERRGLHLSQSIGGVWFGKVTGDPIGGTIVHDEVARLEQQLYHQEQREGAITRTGAQRRFDALVEMATRSRTAPADGKRPAPLFTVLVGYETFHGRICELTNGTVIAPGALVRWLDEAYVERVVFEGPSKVIDVGKRRRLFKGATRRALEVRDLGCYHGTCDEPVDRCQGDHIIPYNDGGPTTVDNGRLACGYHNR